MIGTGTGAGTVRAAGGIVRRRGDDGAVEILLVHRPRYDDWSLPKGKLVPGEDEVTAALREVWEETGVRCQIVRPLGTISYRDASGTPKAVNYFEMRAGPGSGEGSFEPGDEVDAIAWLPVQQALARLTYPHDRELVATFEPFEPSEPDEPDDRR